MIETPLVRTIKLTSRPGKDIEACTRAQFRYFEDWPGLSAFSKKSRLTRRTYDPWDRDRTKRIQEIEGIDQTGVIGPATYGVLLDHMDSLALDLMLAYAESIKPKLVRPIQGWGALSSTLWLAFAEGRRRGFSDLGCYNPSPSNIAMGSDHAVYPAFAFDLGIEPDTGWQHLKARAYAIWTAGRPEVRYTILGDRIWSSRYKVWGSYHGSSHANHLHVSGWRT